MRLPAFLSEQRSVKEQRKLQESDLATVLIGIVAVFVTSHALRISLNVYEMVQKLQKDEETSCYPTWCGDNTRLGYSYYSSHRVIISFYKQFPV